MSECLRIKYFLIICRSERTILLSIAVLTADDLVTSGPAEIASSGGHLKRNDRNDGDHGREKR